MKNLKKSVAILLAVALAAAFMVPVYAATVESDGGVGETTVELTAEAATFSVTVPTSIAIAVNADGTVTCPTNVEIVNDSTAAVKVTGIAMKDGAWALVPYTTDFSKEKVDTKKLAWQMTVGEDVVNTTKTGDQALTHDASAWTMAEKGATLALDCEAKASAVSQAISDKQAAASIVFTIGWAN